jgi:hypothetical protein
MGMQQNNHAEQAALVHPTIKKPVSSKEQLPSCCDKASSSKLGDFTAIVFFGLSCWCCRQPILDENVNNADTSIHLWLFFLP